ncbi:EamA family transporter [uncultured Roseovarius sp.]|uniref:EamA family transporter n=1 Tax=uncultured Roseovarius sp. TaxID=293344 RepID=UPI00263301BF|nr:EamA family transporter [uncultured Roseovarius sp.]
MLPLWVILGLGGVLFSVFGTMFDKYLLERYFNSKDQGGPGALIIFSALFAVTVVLLVVALRYSAIDFSLTVGAVGISAGVINGLWILMYLHAMIRADVSNVVPLFQTVPIFGLVFGAAILGEYLTGPQVLAALVIMSGAIVLMCKIDSGRLGLDVTSMVLMLGSSSCVALSQVVFKSAAVDANYWTAAFWLGVGYMSFGASLYRFVPTYRRQFLTLFSKRRLQIIGVNALNEVFDTAGDLIILAAVVIGPVALVQSLNAYEPMFIFLLSLLLMHLWPSYFQEDISTSALIQKFSGITIIVFGSIFLYSAI